MKNHHHSKKGYSQLYKEWYQEACKNMSVDDIEDGWSEKDTKDDKK